MLCLAGLLTTLAVAGGPGAGVASADCTSGGSGCLPGSGYTLDWTWNCGAIPSGWNCVGANHSWGWGSAAYNGSGVTNVCIRLGGYASACGNNLARVCFAASCNDQDTIAFNASVVNNSPYTHTILGHTKA